MAESTAGQRDNRHPRSDRHDSPAGPAAPCWPAPSPPAGAAAPTFPDNLVVFPDRDFVVVEGYQDHLGETALLEVVRGSTVVGAVRGVIGAGDVAFEVNHPGGYCWGAGVGAGLQVTPNIKAGDTVRISFDGQIDDTTVKDAYVDTDSSLVGSTLTVTGHIADGVNPNQLEQRIVNPDLVGTDVARRDARAIPGPLTPAPKGGYSSMLEVSGNRFIATYEFLTEATAQIAAGGGGERFMSWQEEDADGNRQGLTIAEYGEAGGPGMGGCPAGPADAVAPATGTASVVRSSDRLSMQVNWTPATAVAGAPAVTGYSVAAIGNTVTLGQQTVLGSRTDAAATKTTIAGLNSAENYTVEVRSLAGPRMSEAFATGNTGTPAALGDVTPPTLSTTPAFTDSLTPAVEASQVTVVSDGDVFFTTDGSPAITGDFPSDSARLSTGPIPVTATTEIRFAAFDDAGNSTTGFSVFTPPAAVAAPAAPGAPTASNVGQDRVTLTWPAVATATGYQVQVANAAGVALATQPLAVVNPTQTVTGLTGGTTYQFTVKAKNSAGTFGLASAATTVTTAAATDRVSIVSSRWKVGDFRVIGSGSATGATISVRTGSATGPVIPGATALVTAPVAPATLGDFTIRLRNGIPATNPGQIWITSNRGGVAGPFTVANG